MFTELVGQSAVVRKGGVFKACPLYEYKGMLFVKFGGGFVRLNNNGKSSVEGLTLDHLAYEGPLYADRFDRLSVAAGEGYTPLEALADGTLQPLALEAPK